MTSPSDIRGAVAGRIGFSNVLTPNLVPTVTFEPTIGMVVSRIDKLGLDIRSFRVPLKRAVQNVMIPSIRRNFDVGGRPEWDPLADFTLERRAHEGFGDKILVKSGKLRSVATQLNIWDISTTSAVVRDLPQSAWYGKIHQGGYEGATMGGLTMKTGSLGAASATLDNKLRAALRGELDLSGQGRVRTIPARPFLIIQPEDERAIELIFMRWLGERIAATVGTLP